MRDLKKKKDKNHYIWIPKENYKRIIHNNIESPGRYISKTSKIDSGCTFCKEQYCKWLQKKELNFSALITDKLVCPVDAIKINKEENKMIVLQDMCIGCGLCVFRCPFGAIYLNGKGKAKIKSKKDKNYKMVKSKNHSRQIELNRKLKGGEIIIKRNLDKVAMALDQSIYYSYVSNILTTIGYPTSLARAGDTNDRIDAKIRTKHGIIPIEIKSPMETIKISLKAIRQALENKIVIESRYNEDTNNKSRDLTSLVIGYDKPEKRSDIIRLIRDIKNSYGINIGVLTIDDLLKFLFSDGIDGKKLLNLKGFWNEATS